MRSLAAGEFKTQIRADGEGEFKRNMELTLQTMQTLDTILGEINHVMSRVAIGDLTPRIKTRAAGELQRRAVRAGAHVDPQHRAPPALHLRHRDRAPDQPAVLPLRADGLLRLGGQHQIHALRRLRR